MPIPHINLTLAVSLANCPTWCVAFYWWNCITSAAQFTPKPDQLHHKKGSMNCTQTCSKLPPRGGCRQPEFIHLTLLISEGKWIWHSDPYKWSFLAQTIWTRGMFTCVRFTYGKSDANGNNSRLFCVDPLEELRCSMFLWIFYCHKLFIFYFYQSVWTRLQKLQSLKY